MNDEGAVLLAAAARLAESAGRPQPLALAPMDGGKNNRVYRVETAGEPLVLKCYHRDARDTRDRLGHEWAFLRYVWERGVRNVPEPLAADVAAGLALYPFAPGRKLLSREIDAAAVDAAADFVISANAPPRDTAALPAGSEACFSLTDHIETVARRVARLAAIDPEAPHAEAAADFVKVRLLPAWSAAQARAETAGEGPDGSEIIVSPSDFGFHNAIAGDGGTITFIDFEYAGRDDPAKLVSDFFCCPEAPPPADLRGRFAERLAEGLRLPGRFLARTEQLRDAYRVKWACIVLNDFLPLGAARRAFALADGREERCARQLAKAATLIDGLS